ncbi:hypothetical protein H3C66_01800 [Patescibacteria group bacterium]|nr:hypothetical protein [Patescibacteria group bacterium]
MTPTHHRYRQYLFGLALVSAVFLRSFSEVKAQGTWALGSEFEVSSKYLVVGDRIDVTFKATTKDGKPMTQDRKARYSIRNPKPGQSCETTDDTFKDDGILRGYCEAKGDPGNMEIAISVDDRSTINIDGTPYYADFYKTYNAMFNDPNESCKDANIPPSGVVILKQNDVTVDVKWQHVEKLVGNYDVLYGNSPGEYPHKKTTDQTSIVIDSIDPTKTYYFKVQARSACKTTTSSPAYMYTPSSGAVSAAHEKPTTSVSPSPSSSPTAKATPTLRNSSTPSASATTEATLSTPAARPQPSPTPAAQDTAEAQPRLLPVWLQVVATGMGIGMLAAVGYFLWKKKRLASPAPTEKHPTEDPSKTEQSTSPDQK